jgi:hypothetical protein
MPGLLWPSRRYVDTRNPQGALAAPVGSVCVRLDPATNDVVAIYEKLLGGTTARGWFLAPNAINGNAYHYSPRFNTVSTYAAGFGMPTVIAANPTTVIQGTVVASGGATKRNGQWTGGYTSAVANNVWLLSPSGVLTGVSMDCVGATGNAIADLMPWDCLIEVVTTPRTDSAATAATLATTRIFAGILFQNTTLQLSGGLGNTDLIYTEFASAMAVNAGSYGAMFRFSTGAGDAGWSAVTANDNGAAASQTVTPIAAIAVDTVYRLRLRYVRTGGVWQIRASVNESAETIITANVGPGSTPAASTRKPLAFYVTCRNLGAAVKSLCVGRIWFAQGSGVEL